MTPANIAAYITQHEKNYPNQPISDVHRFMYKDAAEHYPQCSVGQITSRVYDIVKFIQPYVDHAKCDNPSLKIDMLWIDIFDCLAKNPRPISATDGWQAAQKIYPDKPKNNLEINLLLYLFFHNQKMTVEQLQKKLENYLTVAGNNPYLNRSSVELIRYSLWVAEKYPAMPVKTAVRWAFDIAASNIHSRTPQIFDSHYPFSAMHFDTHIDGTATLQVWAKTHFGENNLDCLLNFAVNNDENNFLVKKAYHGVSVKYKLNDDNQEKFKQHFFQFLFFIERTLVPSGEKGKLFHDNKWRFYSAAEKFCQGYQNGFNSLKFLQFKVPNSSEVKETSEISEKMYSAIERFDINQARHLLAHGASPDLTHYGLTLLEWVVSHVGDYSFHIKSGAPSAKDKSEIKKGYKVMIALFNGDYHLYWALKPNWLTVEKIQTKEEIKVLKSISDNKFNPDGKLRTVSKRADIENLTQLILPYVKTSLERQRKEEANNRWEMAKLLLEYNAKPSYRKEPDHPGSTTILEKIIRDTECREEDQTNKALIENYVRLFLRTDKNESHLKVSEKFSKHFLGKIILSGLATLASENAMPAHIKSMRLINTVTIPTLRITNYLDQQVELQSLPLSLFIKNKKQVQEVIDLCKKTFPWQGKMSEKEFTDYIEKKLVPGKAISVIDIILDRKGKIVAFNIADIVPSHESDKAILHYIRLASSERFIQKDFKKLTSFMSFQRILYLEQIFGRDNVLNAFTAASAISYCQTADLDEVSPKYKNCLSPADWQALYDNFFTGREIEEKRYFKSKLYYPAKPRESEFLNQGEINATGYNKFIEKKGYSTLVTFYSSAKNIKKLGEKTQSSGINFIEDAKRAEPLNQFSMQIRSKL